MSSHERLKKIREAMSITQTKMAQIMDIAQNHLYRYEKGLSKLTIDKLNLLHNIGVNTEWLITGQGEMFRDNNTLSVVSASSSDKEETFSVPIFDISASAGGGMQNPVDLIIGTFELGEEFRAYWGGDVGLIRIVGDSMEPTIKRDSWVLVRKCNQLISEGVFIFMHDNELRCKRIFIGMRGQLHIISDNKQYPEEVYTKEDNIVSELTVLAKVICTMNDV